MSELSRLDAEKQAGLFAALKLAPLTKLRRLQGRPDLLVVEVLVDGHSPNGLPNVCVCLRHREERAGDDVVIDSAPVSVTVAEL